MRLMLIDRLYENNTENEARDASGKWTAGGAKPHTMKAKEINKELDALDHARSEHVAKMIAAGRGHEKSNETYKKADDPKDELAKRHKEIADRHHALRSEVEFRYGPGAPRRLPTHKRNAFGPRAQESLEEYITGTDESGYTVRSHTGKRLGKYRSKKAAVKRLRQVEFFKTHPQESLPADLAAIYEADSFANLYQRAGTKIRQHLTGVVNAARSQETPKDLGGVQKHASGVTSYGGEKEGFLSKLKSHFQSAVNAHRASRSIAAAASKAEIGTTDSRPKIGGNPAGPKAQGSFAHDQSRKALAASKTAFLVHKSGTNNPTQLAKVHRSAMALHRTARSEMQNIGEKHMAAQHERMFKTHQKALRQTRAQESVEEDLSETNAAIGHSSLAHDASARAHKSGLASDHKTAVRLHYRAAETHSAAAKASTPGTAAHAYHLDHAKVHTDAVASHRKALKGQYVMAGVDINARLYEGVPVGEREIRPVLKEENDSHDEKGLFASKRSGESHKLSLEHPAYTTKHKVKGISNPVGPLASSGLGMSVLKKNLPGWSREQHAKASAHHKAMAQHHDNEWRKTRDEAHQKTFGKKPEFGDYRISGIGRDEYSTEHKDKLRHHAQTASKHRLAATAHARAAGIMAMRTYGETKESTVDILSRIYEGDAEGTIEKKYPKNNTTSDSSDEYDDDFDDEDWMLDDDEEFEDADNETTLGKPSDNTYGKEKSKPEAEGGGKTREGVEESVPELAGWEKSKNLIKGDHPSHTTEHGTYHIDKNVSNKPHSLFFQAKDKKKSGHEWHAIGSFKTPHEAAAAAKLHHENYGKA